MLILDILSIPIEFIKEHLTGWVLLFIIVFIIYFICLRKYYVQREKFYDMSIPIENLEEVVVSTDNSHDSNIDSRKQFKKERTFFKKSNGVNKQFNQHNSTTQDKSKHLKEGFENNITPSPSISQIDSNLPPISTTLFNNLNLNEKQIQEANINYTKVIAQLIIDLGILNDKVNKNRYLNLKKQFDSLIAKSIDNVMNNLILTIKSPRILTRTAIRTEIINTLNATLENLINKVNQELSVDMNKLAMMNSTTIDYNTQLTTINNSRVLLEKYITLDKLINEYGENTGVSQKEVSSILDKSYILPIYERNFDKISQIAKSDFNYNEGELAMKYSKAYLDFLEQQKKEELKVNPLELASQIESGIVNMFSSIGNSSIKTNKQDNRERQAPLIEQLTRDYGFTNNSLVNTIENTIPKVNNTMLDNTILNNTILNNTMLNKNNIYTDAGNRGSYIVNKNTQNELLEGFASNISVISNTATSNANINTNTNTNISNNNLLKAFDNTVNKKDYNNEIGTKLLSGDFLQYMLDTINKYMNNGYDTYKDKINDYLGGVLGQSNGNGYKFEDNMIPAGFALFILSMLLYFIDLTS